MTAATLRSYTAKDLAQMARQGGVTGWHSMRKEELIRALMRVAQRRTAVRSHAAHNGAGRPAAGNSTHSAVRRVDPQAKRKINQIQDKLAAFREEQTAKVLKETLP